VKERKISICFYSVILLWVLAVQIHASAIYWDTPVVSLGYDKRSEKPISVTKTVVETHGSIWASSWIHEAPRDSQVKIHWYYYANGRKSLLYEESMLVDGTKPIVSNMSFSDVEFFPIGKYIVEFVLDDKSTTSSVFRVIPSSEKNPNFADPYQIGRDACMQPTAIDDERILDDVLEQIPSAKALLRSLDLKRVDAKDHSFSVIVPENWQVYATKAPTILFLKQTGTHKINAEFLVTVIPIGEKFTKTHTPKETVEVYVHELLARLKESNQLIKPLKSITLPDKTIGSYMIQETISGMEIYQFHVLQFMGDKLYDISVFVDKQAYTLGKFLSTLALYSLWVKEECTQEQKISQAHPKTIHSQEHPEKIVARFSPVHPKQKKSCLKSSYEVDNQIVSKVLKRYPNIKKRLHGFPIKRKVDVENGISFILPSTWQMKRKPDQKILLSFSDTIGGKTFDMAISKFPSDELGEVNQEVSGDVVVAVANMLSSRIVTQSEQKGLSPKIHTHPQAIRVDGGIFALTIVSVKQGYQQAWMGIATFYDGEDMYFILSTTDNPNVVYTEFFTALAAYSFKSLNSCK